MEKLIKLLDEYDNKKTEDLERGKQRVENQKLWIISKQFGFIKWLVEKDKIDFEKICHTEFYNSFEGIISFSNVEMLLMYLAMSDTPIDDLISYLKPDDRTSRSTNR